MSSFGSLGGCNRQVEFGWPAHYVRNEGSEQSYSESSRRAPMLSTSADGSVDRLINPNLARLNYFAGVFLVGVSVIQRMGGEDTATHHRSPPTTEFGWTKWTTQWL